MSTTTLPKSSDPADLTASIKRIRAKYLTLRRGSHAVLVQAWEIGNDLLDLRKAVRHSQWERFVETELTFIGLSTAKAYIRLAIAFSTQDELAGLTLEEAKKLAQERLTKRATEPGGEFKRVTARVVTCTKRLHALVNELGRS